MRCRLATGTAALGTAAVLAACSAGVGGSRSATPSSPVVRPSSASSLGSGAPPTRAATPTRMAPSTHLPTATRTPSPTPSRPPTAAVPPALSALSAVPVKGRAPMTGYSRQQFGSAWSDDTAEPFGHNGCDTRNDVLRRDLTGVSIKPRTDGCVVLSGLLHDPYSGVVIRFVRGRATSNRVQIDHVVALGDAWQTGAQQLSAGRRRDLANDPLNLIAVDGPTNEGKGDADAASWLPPNKSFRCAYVARQVAVKAKYRLWMTRAEHDATARVLSRCLGQALPREPGRVGAR